VSWARAWHHLHAGFPRPPGPVRGRTGPKHPDWIHYPRRPSGGRSAWVTFRVIRPWYSGSGGWGYDINGPKPRPRPEAGSAPPSGRMNRPTPGPSGSRSRTSPPGRSPPPPPNQPGPPQYGRARPLCGGRRPCTGPSTPPSARPRHLPIQDAFSTSPGTRLSRQGLGPDPCLPGSYLRPERRRRRAQAPSPSPNQSLIPTTAGPTPPVSCNRRPGRPVCPPGRASLPETSAPKRKKKKNGVKAPRKPSRRPIVITRTPISTKNSIHFNAQGTELTQRNQIPRPLIPHPARREENLNGTPCPFNLQATTPPRRQDPRQRLCSSTKRPRQGSRLLDITPERQVPLVHRTGRFPNPWRLWPAKLALPPFPCATRVKSAKEPKDPPYHDWHRAPLPIFTRPGPAPPLVRPDCYVAWRPQHAFWETKRQAFELLQARPSPSILR